MRHVSRALLPFAMSVLVICLAPVALGQRRSDTALSEISANDNRAPAGRLESGVLTLHLELREGVWHPQGEDSKAADGAGTSRTLDVSSFAEEGHEPQMPGPLIRVPQGTELHVSVLNRLPVRVFIHGLDQHPGNDANVMQLAPGETKETRFTAGEPGSYVYWAATSEVPTLRAGFVSAIETRPGPEGTMSGAFIVDPPGAAAADRIFVIQLWERSLFHREFEAELVVNGRAWPYTERLHARLGQAEHWRVVNASPLPHPMHLHGFYFYVDAVGDGQAAHRYTPEERRLAVTETVMPGHTFDLTWTPDRPGNWIFHCHILAHMSNYKAAFVYGPEGPPPMAKLNHMSQDDTTMGMAGLVLGITVNGDNPRLQPASAAVPAAERHLFVRQRPGLPFVPAGPGFYLDGVSRDVGSVGPPLVVTRGVRTAITVTNELKEPTAIHWHGLEIESYYDGVPGWTGTFQRTTPPIAPGTSFIAYLTPPRAGTFIYHTHWHNVAQLTGGMYGALLVLPPGQDYDPVHDKVFVLGRGGPNAMADPLMLNGSPQPGVMVLLRGQSYRFRLINMTPNDAPVDVSLTLDGQPTKWRAIAKDGADLPRPQATIGQAVQELSVGETSDFEFAPQQPGLYKLRFCAPRVGSEVTQSIVVAPPEAAISVFAKR